MKRLIIGLTGAFGSGTSFLATNFFENKHGFLHFSLSSILKDCYKKETGKDEVRHELQEYGNKLRKENPSILAQKLFDEQLSSIDCSKDIIIESIRNPAEILFFREKYPEFVLIGIFADNDTRWERVKDNYSYSRDRFNEDDMKDKGKNEPDYGQRISDCFFEADLILSNNSEIFIEGENEKYKNMDSTINAYIEALRQPLKSEPTLEETLMAAAYVSGRRSKCFKRKVGAVITDKYDRIISSGFNGVPVGLNECKSQFGHCYRDDKRKEIAKKIGDELGNISDVSISVVKKNIKLLELCRALHGEESAILNLVGKGVDLSDSTIYVTTFPCNLCANKIVQAGIKNVVYFEPYPVDEAKRILREGGVEYRPFEGVTFRAFFRFYQYEA